MLEASSLAKAPGVARVVTSDFFTPALNAETSADDIDRRSDIQPMVDNGLLESDVPGLRLRLLRVEMAIVRCCEFLKYSRK